MGKNKKKKRKGLVPVSTNVPGGGNREQEVVHDVAVLNAEWEFVIVDNDKLVVEVTESYVWNQEHRNQPKQDKGIWTIPECEELKLFHECRREGSFVPWKKEKKTHKGWWIKHINGANHIIGRDYLGNGVKVCRFVEGNVGKWHGFPVNYMSDKEIISDHVLRLWAYDLGYVDKSELLDIKRHQKSSLA